MDIWGRSSITKRDAKRGRLARAGLCALLLVVGALCARPTRASGPIRPRSTSPAGDGASRGFFGVEIEELACLNLRRELATRPTIITYTVQPGDTVSAIARRFGLTIDTVRWSNPALERNPDYLLPGMDLTILPVRGVYHQVAAGDMLEKIAARYGVRVEDIANYPLNHLSGERSLRLGSWLVIPYGTKSLVRPKPALAPDYLFAWPIVGYITQGYSSRHRAIDIGAPYGSSVYAARAGVVAHAGWAETGYGYTIIIDHGEGYRTLYSHLKGTWVSAGQRVSRGQLVGEVGSTGNSSGPHVHFEIRVNGVRADPLELLSPQ